MTVSTSTDPSAPLVVVVGSTGIQGGSVIHNLVASDRAYRLRGLTRDISKPAAMKIAALGVDMVAVDISIGNEAAVRHAFHDADIVFAMTNYWEHMDSAREIAEGILMAEAAKAIGAKLFLFSGLPSIVDMTGGKYSRIKVADGKARVVNYARTLLPVVDVQAGFYNTNLLNPAVGPVRLADGSYVWEQLKSQDLPVPYIDAEHDYGLYVRYAIETFLDDAGSVPHTIYTYSELLRHSEVAEILARVRGIRVNFKSLAGDSSLYRKKLEDLGMQNSLVSDMLESSAWFSEYGCFFGLESTEEQKMVQAGLARKPRTFEDFLTANPLFMAA